jgi:hypothetical protein
MNSYLRALVCLLLALPGVSLLQAADTDGNYAVKGAGIATCAAFNDAREAGGREYYMFAGWMEGFLTAGNLYEEETFDIAPWQNTEVLAAALDSLCKRNPQQKFHLAAAGLMREFFPARLRQQSLPVVVGGEEDGVVVYQEVLDRVASRLRELDYLGEGMAAGDATATALARYQEAMDIPVTRLPDQLTLLYLFTDVGDSVAMQKAAAP